MSIVVTIVKSPGNAICHTSSVTFDHSGGTIGRGVKNTLSLDDPERFISSQHSEIVCENNQYFLVDLSTNGTFHNGANEPIGKGNRVELKDGDKFSLSDYEFIVNVCAPVQQNSSPLIDNGPFATPSSTGSAISSTSTDSSPATSDSFSTASIDELFSVPVTGHISSVDSLFGAEPQETDPLLALDRARSVSLPSDNSALFDSGFSQGDNADVMTHSMIWPDSIPDAGMIPDDWDDELDSSEAEQSSSEFNVASTGQSTHGSSDRKSELDRAHEKILAEIEELKKQASQKPQPQAAAAETQIHSRMDSKSQGDLIAALGFADRKLSDEKVEEICQQVGELVRETVGGMMKVLSSRSAIKNEFRMNVTTIQPIENNPLKFSANVDDAMENMFIKGGNSYIGPVFAIREGFDGIAEHQLALLAGIRTAFKSVLDKFNPDALEQRFEKFRKSGIIPGSNKARNWEMYQSFYQELVDDLDNSFQHLFAYDFVKAYEDQLYKLSITRKTGSQ